MRFQFSGGAWRVGKGPLAKRYLFAIFLFVVALAARFMLADLLPARGFPFLSFFPAVLLAAYVVGIGPGLLVAILSTCSAWAFFMGPRMALSAMPQSDIIALGFFAVILIVDCLVIERMNLTMLKLRTTSRKLQLSEDSLVMQQAQLREADIQKDVFIATLAHELRNPLAPIISAAQLISIRSNADEQLDRAASIIMRQSLQLTRLVDDLLDASRIRSGKLTLELMPTHLQEVIASALETSAPMMEHPGINFSVEMPSQPIPVEADSTRIAQCVSNLLQNAFKFSTAPAKISLVVSVIPGNMASISVTDTGTGIAPEMLPRLFEMFAQEARDDRAGNSGLGIGLALTNDLVSRHGGNVTAYSDGIGHGARFEILLPIIGTISPTRTTRYVQSSSSNDDTTAYLAQGFA
jgi:signal transduction histidine kinase